MVLPYTQVVAGLSTNVETPTTEQINQGNDRLTPYNSSKNNGYYRQMSQGIFSLSSELQNVFQAGGITPSTGLNLLPALDALYPRKSTLGTASTKDVGTSSNQIPLVQNVATLAIPAGAIMPFAMSSIPSGWLECDGSAVSRSTYSALIAAIGLQFGAGNGSTTFNLPDLRGYFVRGWSHGSSIDSGRSFGSTQLDEIKAHTHSLPNVFFQSSPQAGAGSGTLGQFANITGSTGGTETRPINLALLYCIKY